MSHTKGPWKFVPPWNNAFRNNEHYQITGTFQGNPEDAEDGPIKLGEEILLAQTFWGACESNAKLIAAAPDLYEACVAAFGALPDSENDSELYWKLKNAIRKVRTP